MAFWVWLLSLGMMFLRFIRIIAHTGTLFLFMSRQYFMIWKGRISSLDGHWVVFTFWVLRIALLWTMVYKCLSVCFQFLVYTQEWNCWVIQWFCMGFPRSSVGKESACNVGDPGSIPGLGRSEEDMATHFGFLVWRIPMDRGPGRLQSPGSQRVRHHWATRHPHAHIQNM